MKAGGFITNLSTYFPIIRKREEILSEITNNDHLKSIFSKWKPKQQQEFLDFCCGNRGVKILYDSFFKEILNPEYAPERLEDLLSLLLGKKVRILTVLPNDSTRIADESSLLITDIVVELEDGSIANIEIQKIGYRFPGQRSACYSADLLLRQYKRIRGAKEKTFNYKDIKSVYIIVFFENSPKQFQEFSQEYLHYFQQTSNTGIELELLQKYLFVPLDIFKKTIHNKPIKTKIDAWLLFLSTEDPEKIFQLIQTYPEFKIMYDEIYQLCLNTEKVMDMFSKELLQLDRNTVQYMMDEMQEEINSLQNSNAELQNSNAELQNSNAELQNSNTELQNSNAELQNSNAELQDTNKKLQEKLKIMEKQLRELKGNL